MTSSQPLGPVSREGELPATVRAPTELPATVRALGWTSFLTDLSSEAIYPLLPAFVKGLGGTGFDIGLIDGVANAVAAVVRLFAETLSDRLGRSCSPSPAALPNEPRPDVPAGQRADWSADADRPPARLPGGGHVEVGIVTHEHEFVRTATEPRLDLSEELDGRLSPADLG